MAIALRGTATGNALDTGDITITMPGGTVQNDVVYAASSHGGSSVTNWDFTMGTAGYTELADLLDTSDSIVTNFGLFRKVQGSTPDSNAVLQTSQSSTSVGYSGILVVLSGVDTTTPEDATNTSATGGNTAVVDCPSITTVTANAWVLAFGGAGNGGTIASAGLPSGYSNLIDSRETTESFNAQTVSATKLVSSPGAENPGPFTGMSTNTASSWAGATVAARPQATGGSLVFAPPPAAFFPLLVR